MQYSPLSSTGIGSLPHLNVNSALKYSFRHEIPFLPQLPILNPRERMIHQALAGFPGVQAPIGPQDSEVGVLLDPVSWQREREALKSKLDAAFWGPNRKNAFEEFLPRHEDYCALHPFIWKLSEHESPVAKLQLAGPITTIRNTKTRDGSELEPALEKDLQSFLLARAIAMTRLVLEALPVLPMTQVYFSWDEPCLFALNPQRSPLDAAALRELALQLDAIRNRTDPVRVKTGLHCCSDPDWTQLLNAVKPDILSVDASVSLHSLSTAHRPALDALRATGLKLFWGVIPSNLTLTTIEIPTPLRYSSFFTSACGLAYHTPLECEEVFERLTQAAHWRTTE